MFKQLNIFSVALFFSVQLSAQAPQPAYSAYINLATFPGLTGFNGRLYHFKYDTILVMNRKGQLKINDTTYKDTYDSSYYSLSAGEIQKIITTLRAVDSLESVFNFCIIDGLRFYFSCSIDTIEYNAWVGNAYDPVIYLFVDILNKNVPEKFQIWYDKDQMIREEKRCLKERFGIIK